MHKIPSNLPPAIPFDEDKVNLDPRWFELPESECDVFEQDARSILHCFRRSYKYDLRGQMKLYE